MKTFLIGIVLFPILSVCSYAIAYSHCDFYSYTNQHTNTNLWS